MLRFVRTCWACPEQYNAYLGDRQVGYLRLRHGFFVVECPVNGGMEVYSAHPSGDGIFDPSERDRYLRNAANSIYGWVMNEFGHDFVLDAYEVVEAEG
jgi:hypothetical protein